MLLVAAAVVFMALLAFMSLIQAEQTSISAHTRTRPHKLILAMVLTPPILVDRTHPHLVDPRRSVVSVSEGCPTCDCDQKKQSPPPLTAAPPPPSPPAPCPGSDTKAVEAADNKSSEEGAGPVTVGSAGTRTWDFAIVVFVGHRVEIIRPNQG